MVLLASVALPREPSARIEGAGKVATRCEDGLSPYTSSQLQGTKVKDTHSPFHPPLQAIRPIANFFEPQKATNEGSIHASSHSPPHLHL